MKKFYHSRQYLLFIISLFVFAITIALIERGAEVFTSAVPLMVMLVFVLAAIDLAFGIYVRIRGDYLEKVQDFIVTRKIKISEIKYIHYAPTFIVGRATKSLFISAELNNEKQTIVMPNVGYGKEAYINVIKALREINPSISLDKEAQILISE